MSYNRPNEILYYLNEDGDVEEQFTAGIESEIFECERDIERVIFQLEADQTLLLLFRHMGYDAKEIVEVLGLKNIGKYYRTSFRLRRNYERIKGAAL